MGYSFAMTFNTSQINQLKQILDDLGLKYTDEEIQEAGLRVVRFVVCKERHTFIDNEKER